MANNCHNFIEFSDISETNIEKVLNWLKTYDQFEYLIDWVNSFVSEENQRENYGARWFDSNVNDIQPNYLQLVGDSAWSPMLGMCEALAAELECIIKIEYWEAGSNIAGFAVFNNGEKIESWDGTYLEGQYILNGGINALINEIDSSTNINSFLGKCKNFLPKYHLDDLVDYLNKNNLNNPDEDTYEE